MKFLKYAKKRHTCKAYNPAKSIAPEILEQFLEVLRLTPSSINIQPWQFIVVKSADAKQKIANAMPDRYDYNIPKVVDAPVVIIFAAKTDIDDDHLAKILDSEEQAGRFRTEQSKETQRTSRLAYLQAYREKDLDRWIDSQVLLPWVRR